MVELIDAIGGTDAGQWYRLIFLTVEQIDQGRQRSGATPTQTWFLPVVNLQPPPFTRWSVVSLPLRLVDAVFNRRVPRLHNP